MKSSTASSQTGSAIKKVLEHIFQKSTLQDIPQSDFEALVEQYPYFPAARLLLVKKLLQSRSPTADDEIATAALYFHNPLWFQWLMADQRNDQTIEKPGQKNESGLSNDSLQPGLDPHQTSEFHRTPHETLHQQTANSDVSAQTDNQATGYFQSSSAKEESIETMSNGEPAGENERPNNNEETNVLQSTIGLQSEPSTDSTAAREETIKAEASSQPLQGEDSRSNNGEKNQISYSQEDLGHSTPESITFEPLHTVDYFASQGIKLRQEELDNDRLGKQLKSFTDWLRSMKRLPSAEDPKIEENTERAVRHIAEHSLDEKEILTETMAEVWAKQGQTERAIEIYRKLSLKNPSKSSYFAAQIEKLKE